MKIVLDTNVLIDAFADLYSYEQRIINEVIAGNVEAYANRETLSENKLISKRLIEDGAFQRYLETFYEQVNWVKSDRSLRVVSDEEDNKILASALTAGANYLITSDNALLGIGKYQRVKIVRPAEFWVKYKDEGMDFWNQMISFVKGQSKS